MRTATTLERAPSVLERRRGDPETTPIARVRVLRTGAAEVHHEHVHGTRKPALWWIFFGKRFLRLPINFFAIEHAQGLVLFDAGQDRTVLTDREYYPDPVTRFFSEHLFHWHLGPEDTLTTQLERAGYWPSDVRKLVVSHLHADHVGGISEVLQAELYSDPEGLAYMRGGDHPERHMVYRERIELPGADWRALEFEPTEDPDLAPFRQACDLMGDGSLVVLRTPGHLPGSVSMLVRDEGRPPLLLVGDLTYSDELLERGQLPGTGDKVALLESFAKVRALRERNPGLVLLPAHDLRAAEKLERVGY